MQERVCETAVDERGDQMAAPQQVALRAVTAEEQAALTQLSQASSERVDRVRRATALLGVAAGGSFAQAARQAGFRSSTAVVDLVGRFNRHGLGALAIAPGRGLYWPFSLSGALTRHARTRDGGRPEWGSRAHGRPSPAAVRPPRGRRGRAAAGLDVAGHG